MSKYETLLLVLMAATLALAVWHGLKTAGRPEMAELTLLEAVPAAAAAAAAPVAAAVPEVSAAEPEKKSEAAKPADDAKAPDVSTPVLANIFNRKSVRSYADREVAREELVLLAKAAMAAPTARDSRPWYILATNKPSEIAKLSEAYAQIGRAKAVLILCGNKDKFLPGDNELYWMQDCAAATENALLAAEARGLGAVWLGICPNKSRMDGLKKVLSLPDNLVPFSVISIGYPAGDAKPKDKWDERSFRML